MTRQHNFRHSRPTEYGRCIADRLAQAQAQAADGEAAYESATIHSAAVGLGLAPLSLATFRLATCLLARRLVIGVMNALCRERTNTAPHAFGVARRPRRCSSWASLSSSSSASLRSTSLAFSPSLSPLGPRAHHPPAISQRRPRHVASPSLEPMPSRSESIGAARAAPRLILVGLFLTKRPPTDSITPVP